MSRPAQLGATGQEILGRLALSAVAGTQERIRNVIPPGPGGVREIRRDPGHEAQSGSLPERRFGTSLDEQSRGSPLPKRHGVRQLGATTNNVAARLKIRAMQEQYTENSDVIGAGRPTQGRFRMATNKRGVDSGAGCQQFLHTRGVVRKVAGLIRRDLEKRAFSIDGGSDQIGIVRQDLSKRFDVTAADRRAAASAGFSLRCTPIDTPAIRSLRHGSETPVIGSLGPPTSQWNTAPPPVPSAAA